MSNTIDLDELLLGLGSADFNDFEDDDDFGDPIDEPETQAKIPQTSTGEEKLQEDDHDDPFLASMPVNGPIGFATAGGKALPPPSEAAISKARKIIAIDEVSDEAPPDVDVPNKRRRLDIPMISMFTTGGGAAMPPPSREALARVADIFADTLDDAPEMTSTPVPGLLNSDGSSSPATTQHTPEGGPSAAMFTTASGNAVPPPSRSAQEKIASLFGNIENEPIKGHATPSLSEEIDIPMPFSTPAPASSSRARVMSIFGETDQASRPHLGGVKSSFGLPGPANNAQPAATFTPPRTTSTFSRSMAKQTPLSTKTNTFGRGTDVRMGSQSKPNQIRTPGPVRRIGLGGTPKSAPGKVKSSFVTPFKDPRTSQTAKAVTQLRSSQTTPLRGPPIAAPAVHRSVFDLTLPPDRQTLKQAYLKPQYNTINELREMGLPDDIWTLDLSNAVRYRFIAENATPLGSQNAWEVLRREGCSLATRRWIDNHYSLILWKLAGEIQAQPSLFDRRWNWGEVIEQLQYRYEREFIAAQRPIVRRIQEHDSTAAVPMVLCISAIRRPASMEDEQGKLCHVKPYLELTDGWYRINAEVDECLTRAVAKEKIVVGRKLEISGAKLDSASDGDDVLDALDRSRLVVSANSCFLAPWDVKLGRQVLPFVAGLSHLSNDGGLICLMDITVEKVFPLAFMNAERGSKEAPWDEAEEAVRADRWKELYESESRRLNDEMRGRISLVEDLAQMLSSTAEDAERSSGSPPDTLDEDFDMLLKAKDQIKALRSFSDGHIRHLAGHARHMLEREMQDAQIEVQAKLTEIHPPRQTRDFRMVRFVDARQQKKDPARVGMLNVWDARALGEDAIQESRRYMASPVVPILRRMKLIPSKGIKSYARANGRLESAKKRWEEGSILTYKKGYPVEVARLSVVPS